MTWILWLLAGLLLFGLLAELAARLWLRLRGGYYVLPPWSRSEMTIDRSVLPQLEERVRIEANRDGERGPEPPRNLRETYRVLIAGGSAAECYMLDQDSEWAAVVRRELAGKLERLGAGAVHVGNLARSLVPCEAIDLILAKALPRYPRLDVLVLMIGASDVVAWLERGCPAEIEPGEYTPARVFAEHPEGPFGWTPRKLALRRIVQRLQRRLFPRVARRSNVGGMIAKNRAMRARAAMRDEVPDPTPMIEGFETWLRRVIATARSKAKRVIVVRQPWLKREFTPEEDARLWNFGAGRPYAEEVTTYFTHRVVNDLMGAVADAAGRVAEECGVEQLDLMERLDPTFETFYDRLHFTREGAGVVGRAVAEAILSGGEALPAAGAHPRDRTESKRVEVKTDPRP